MGNFIQYPCKLKLETLSLSSYVHNKMHNRCKIHICWFLDNFGWGTEMALQQARKRLHKRVLMLALSNLYVMVTTGASLEAFLGKDLLWLILVHMAILYCTLNHLPLFWCVCNAYCAVPTLVFQTTWKKSWQEQLRKERGFRTYINLLRWFPQRMHLKCFTRVFSILKLGTNPQKAMLIYQSIAEKVPTAVS